MVHTGEMHFASQMKKTILLTMRQKRGIGKTTLAGNPMMPHRGRLTNHQYHDRGDPQ